MPELPEVESVRRQLAPRLEGRRIEAVHAAPQARFDDVDEAAGRRVHVLRRRGKYLIAELEGGLELVMHLGMTGSFRFRGDPWPAPGGESRPWGGDAYVRATFTLDDGVLDFRDVRRFGRLSVVPAGEYAGIETLAKLGPEPLSEAFDPGGFARALAGTSTMVKPYLLSQRPVAGVGNIYADEALWRARIHPCARAVGPRRARALWQAIREVLAESVEREGTTFRDYLMVNGESGRNAAFLVAYGQAGRPCPRCATPLRKTVVAGRGTTYCPRCQRH
ncbi:MAG TPA: bifunctional DNA-formamidopyrimidine glycosylase/DNA-(apurinic or apyrimidinic site) lyase [Egibacteraceae bacterium]|nr:bifunctional DNA-formamidopyrimidine glycosylase/DNA-(apurinic or apyrimidinic site) lyase [Egibacteraceae bacterium]